MDAPEVPAGVVASGGGGGAGRGAIRDPGRFRSYLLVCARLHMGSGLRARLSPSDIVQEVLLDACRERDRLRAQNTGGELAWLRAILSNRIRRAARDLRRDKRDARREVSLDAALERTTTFLERSFADSAKSPSEELEKEEHLLRVCEALLELPDSQRQAVLLRYAGGLSQAEIAAELGTTPGGAAGLIHRGLQNLRAVLEPR